MAAADAPAEAKHPTAGRAVVVSGKKLWVEEQGTGDPVVLIAGGPGCAHGYFHPHFDVLAQKHRVIYFDSVGRGKSDKAAKTSEYTLQRDVDDLEALRKALKLERITLFGHSYGGLVAIQYALQHPTSVKKLVIANSLYSAEMWQANNDSSNLNMRQQLPEAWAKLTALRERGLRSSDKEHQEIYAIPPGLLYFKNPDDSKKAVFECNNDVYYQMVGVDGDFIIGGDIGPVDLRAQLKNLKMPTLIWSGRFDRVCLPSFAAKWKDYAPQAQFVMFEDSGHYPFVEEPAHMFEVLETFLAKP